MTPRKAEASRSTKETEITVSFNLDGRGESRIDTGIGFFDHMLASFARHGLFDLEVKVGGDLQVDTHHTAEDTGIVLGTAIAKALGGKEQIRRFGQAAVPMDEALVETVVDLSGRPYLVWHADLPAERIGELETEVIREFFYAVAMQAAITLHINEYYGENAHHIAEAAFKSFGRALAMAASVDDRIEGVLSTKGSL